MKGSRDKTSSPQWLRLSLWSLPVLAAILLLAGFHQQDQKPCRNPVTYRIGTIDERFGLSRQEVADAVAEAAALWERASGRELFQEERQGVVEIDFVYDHRQAASDKLNGLSINIDNSKGSYEALKAHLEYLEAEFRDNKAALESDIESYNARIKALEDENEAASRGGGLSEEAYLRLSTEKDALDALREDLQVRKNSVENSAETLKSLVVVINEIANNLNLEVVKYNNTGKELGNEFSEGCFEIKDGRQSITIFHFTDHTRLVRILAHELGHSLGLKHNDNPRSIMYRLNASDDATLSPEDLAALKERCEGD